MLSTHAGLDGYMDGGPGDAKPVLAICNIQHRNNIDSGASGFRIPNIWFAQMTSVEVWTQYGNQIGVEIHWTWRYNSVKKVVRSCEINENLLAPPGDPSGADASSVKKVVQWIKNLLTPSGWRSQWNWHKFC